MTPAPRARPSPRRGGRRRARAGVSIVEVLIAVSLLGIVVTGLLSSTLAIARRTNGVSWTTSRNGALLQEVNRFTAMPYADLPAAAGCTTVLGTAGQPYAYTRCAVVESVGATQRQVRLTVVPANSRLRPDTMYVRRADVATVPY